MRPYSQDLRERVRAALEAQDGPQSEVAETFGVSLSFVEKLWRRWRQTGRGAAVPHAGGRQRTLRGEEARLRAAVAKQPDITLRELCEHVARGGGANASPSMMGRELQRLELPRKKSRSMTGSGRRRG
jgi:transposase